jgi:hypothetical protein
VLSKFISRKFLLALVAFITVNVMPNLDAGAQAKWSAFVAAAYAIGQGIADGFGSGAQPSQGGAGSTVPGKQGL